MKWTERVNNFAVTAELIGMVALVVLLFIVGVIAHKLSVGNLFSRGDIPAEGYWSFGTATAAGPWMLGFLLGAFTIVGFESAANLAEETKRPEVVVPRAMWQAVLASGVLGFLFLLVVTAAVDDPVALAESGTPIADVIRDILGSFVGTALLILVAIAIFACGLVISLSGVRLVWAMSRDQRFPGWQALQKVNPRTKTPLNATIAMTAISAIILGLFSTSTDALFKLFSAATLLPAIIYAITVTSTSPPARSCRPVPASTSGAGRSRSWWWQWSGWCSRCRCSGTPPSVIRGCTLQAWSRSARATSATSW